MTQHIGRGHPLSTTDSIAPVVLSPRGLLIAISFVAFAAIGGLGGGAIASHFLIYSSQYLLIGGMVGGGIAIGGTFGSMVAMVTSYLCEQKKIEPLTLEREQDLENDDGLLVVDRYKGVIPAEGMKRGGGYHKWLNRKALFNRVVAPRRIEFLEETVYPKKGEKAETEEIHFGKGRLSDESFKTMVLKEKIKTKKKKHKTVIKGNREFYEYGKKGKGYSEYANSYLIFANDKHYGGGIFNGHVQEETIIAQFKGFLPLRYLAGKFGLHLAPTAKGNSKEPEPYFVFDTRQHHVMDNDIYGEKLYKVKSGKVKDHVRTKGLSQSPVTFAGIAAKPWPITPRNAYTKEDLEYHAKAAYIAMEGIKLAEEKKGKKKKICIHTGEWGSGVFHNSVKAMTLLQVAVAMKIGGVTLVFHNMTGQREGYTKKFLAECIDIVKDKGTLEDVISYILEQQDEDDSWAPMRHVPQQNQNKEGK